jgi:hypothetical protein
MISIKRYLYGKSPEAGAPSQAGASASLLTLCARLFERVGQHVLGTGQQEPLRAQWSELESSLRPEIDDEQVEAIDRSAARILGSYQAAAQQSATRTAVEMQNIVATLNQALMVVAGGSERSVTRLQGLQDSLRGASMLQDIIALKSALVDTVKFVEKELAEERQTVAKEQKGLEARIAQARAAVGNAFSGLPGRPEAVRALSESLQAASGGAYLVCFLLDRLDAMVHRYGPSVADELILLLIKDRLQAVAPEYTAYRWTASSLVGFFHSERDAKSLRVQLAELNRSPLVHRVPLGNRTAVLTVSPSHLLVECSGVPAGAAAQEVDRFTGALAA